MEKKSDVELIILLQSSDRQKSEIGLGYLYRFSFATIKRFILKKGGNEQDADDIFQDGLIAIYMMAQKNKLNKDTNVEAYLFTICRNAWKKKTEKQIKEFELKSSGYLVHEEEIQIEKILSKERQNVVARLLKQLGEECENILVYYYFERWSMKQIQETLNLSSEQLAKNKKYKCMKKLRSLITSLPGNINYLKS